MSKKKSTQTIGQWLDTWFSVYAVPEYEKNTVALYEDARRRLNVNCPGMESLLLEELLPVQFQAAMNQLANRYSKSTIRHIKSMYHMAYEKAIDNRLCGVNPIDKTVLPKNASEKLVTALSREEQEAFERAAHQLPIRDEFILRTYLLTGLRPGELRFLRWEDWDQSRKILKINMSKTKAGIREVPVIPEVMVILIHLHAWKKGTSEKEYIFGGEKPLDKYHLRHICKRVSTIANIRHVTPHMLRHTFATRMIDRGAEIKSLSVILGHTKPEFTLRRYITPDQGQLYDQMMLLSNANAKRNPLRRPSCFAISMPSSARCRMQSRSSWARAPKTVNINCPCGVVVSMDSLRLINATFFFCSSSTINSKSRVLRAIREMSEHTTVSPSRAKASMAVSWGRSLFLPEALSMKILPALCSLASSI